MNGLTDRQWRRLIEAETLYAGAGHRSASLAEEIDRLRTAFEFPLAEFDGRACPNCGALDLLRLAEDTTRFYHLSLRTEGGERFLLAHDESTADDGQDQHLECLACFQNWAVSDDIQFG